MRTHSSTGRFAAVAIAAAVVAVPLFAATPAFADASAVTEVAFPVSTISGGGYTQAYFNGNTTLTEVADFDACFAEYKNGVVTQSGGTQYASSPVQYDYLATQGYAEGDTFAVSFFDSDPDFGWCTVAPNLETPGLVTASVLLGAPTPEPVAGVEVPVTVSDVKLQVGVAVDQLVSYSAPGLSFAAVGGYIGFGAQMGNEPEPGYVDPFSGLTFESLHEFEPGVAPQLRVTGTPKYTGSISTGFQIVDGTNSGVGAFSVLIAGTDGVVSPISIQLALGQPVSGATIAVVASGLQPGSAFGVTVRSTPIIVNSGTIGLDGNLTVSATIPAGLEAGYHSITLTGTNADGSAYSSVVYFRVSASGNLLSVSNTDPQLAATGADITPAAIVGGSLLLAGLVFGGVAMRRRRASN